jgi:hypothetical protein
LVKGGEEMALDRGSEGMDSDGVYGGFSEPEFVDNVFVIDG